MTKAAIAIAAIVALAATALLLRDDADSGAGAGPPAQPAAVPAIGWTSAPPDGRPQQPTLVQVAQPESLPQSDATGLLEPSLTIDELLDRIDADTQPGTSPVDRGQLAVALRADPAIRNAMAD